MCENKISPSKFLFSRYATYSHCVYDLAGLLLNQFLFHAFELIVVQAATAV